MHVSVIFQPCIFLPYAIRWPVQRTELSKTWAMPWARWPTSPGTGSPSPMSTITGSLSPGHLGSSDGLSSNLWCSLVRDGKMDASGNPWESGSGLRLTGYRRWNIIYSSVADPGCLSRIQFFPSLTQRQQDSGSQNRIRIKEFRHFNPFF